MVLKLGFIWHKTVNSICEQFLFAKKRSFAMSWTALTLSPLLWSGWSGWSGRANKRNFCQLLTADTLVWWIEPPYFQICVLHFCELVSDSTFNSTKSTEESEWKWPKSNQRLRWNQIIRFPWIISTSCCHLEMKTLLWSSSQKMTENVDLII